MSTSFKEQLGLSAIALVNGIFVYPYLKKFYRKVYSIDGSPTHYAYFDVEIDGKDAGRINFELYGEQAPKTVNNFLAFCSGDYHRFMRYKDSRFHSIVPGKFIKGGDFARGDGTGAKTVYDKPTIEREKNNIKFKEPFLLAASANDQGQTGSQFFITLDALPALNGSDHTIFGKLISGRETVQMIEGVNDFRKSLAELKNEEGKNEAMVQIKNSGVYKFEARANELRKRSAAGVYDFNPQDFYESRKNK